MENPVSNPIRFFVDKTFKVWSENGHVKQCQGNSDSLEYVKEIAGESNWEVYSSSRMGEEFETAFNLVLAERKR